MCETKDGKEKQIRLLNTEKADIAIIASFEASGEAGTLPSMLWKAMKKFGEPPKVSEKSWSKKVTKKAYLSQLKKDLSKIFEV